MPPEKIRTVRLVIRPTSICKKVRFVMQRHLTDANNRPPPIAPVLPEFPVPSLSSLPLPCFMPSYERDLKGSLCECFKSYAPKRIFEGHNFFFYNSVFSSYSLIRVPSFFLVLSFSLVCQATHGIVVSCFSFEGPRCYHRACSLDT